MTKLKKVVILFIAAFITSFFLVAQMGTKLNNKLYNYVNAESKRVVSNIVNYSINEIIEENIEEDLFEITKNTRGEIELLDYNTKEVNKLLKIVNQNIQKKLLKLEEGNISEYAIAETFKKGKFKNVKSGIICEIPIGMLKENAFYSNFGPNIPIRMTFLSSIKSYITTNITPYGFNSLVLEININVEIEERISMPTSSKITKLKIKSPLTLKVIQGIIPEYYYIKGLEKISNQYADEDDIQE